TVSDNGVLVYKTVDRGASSQFSWFDRTGQPLGIEPIDSNVDGVSISSDNKRIAFRRRELSGSLIIWVRDLVRGTNTPVTQHPGALGPRGDNYNPIWSPDGATIFFFPNPNA